MTRKIFNENRDLILHFCREDLLPLALHNLVLPLELWFFHKLLSQGLSTLRIGNQLLGFYLVLLVLYGNHRNSRLSNYNTPNFTICNSVSSLFMLPLKITKTETESGEDNEQSNEDGKNVGQPTTTLVPDRRISRAM